MTSSRYAATSSSSRETTPLLSSANKNHIEIELPLLKKKKKPPANKKNGTQIKLAALIEHLDKALELVDKLEQNRHEKNYSYALSRSKKNHQFILPFFILVSLTTIGFLAAAMIIAKDKKAGAEFKTEYDKSIIPNNSNTAYTCEDVDITHCITQIDYSCEFKAYDTSVPRSTCPDYENNLSFEKSHKYPGSKIHPEVKNIPSPLKEIAETTCMKTLEDLCNSFIKSSPLYLKEGNYTLFLILSFTLAIPSLAGLIFGMPALVDSTLKENLHPGFKGKTGLWRAEKKHLLTILEAFDIKYDDYNGAKELRASIDLVKARIQKAETTYFLQHTLFPTVFPGRPNCLEEIQSKIDAGYKKNVPVIIDLESEKKSWESLSARK